MKKAEKPEEEPSKARMPSEPEAPGGGPIGAGYRPAGAS
jgi:hypothetical protein